MGKRAAAAYAGRAAARWTVARFRWKVPAPSTAGVCKITPKARRERADTLRRLRLAYAAAVVPAELAAYREAGVSAALQ